MSRYIAIADAPGAWKSDSEYGWQERPTATVWEECPTPKRTGLLNAHGTPLYRLRETVPLGFAGAAGRAGEPRH